MKNYYDILEISVDASKEQIKEAYKKLAVLYHPDKNLNNSSTVELFKDVNEAKQILFDDVKKAEYDLILTDWVLAHHKDNFKRKTKLEKVQNYGSNLDLKSKTLGKFALLGVAAIIITLFIVNYPEDKIVSKPKYLSNRPEATPVSTMETGKEISNTPAIKQEEPKHVAAAKPVVQEIVPVSKTVEPAKEDVIRQNEIAALQIAEKDKIEKMKTEKAIAAKKVAAQDAISKEIAARNIVAKDNNAKEIITKDVVEETIAREQLSPQEMSKIINEIKREKTRTHNSSNCIQVCKTRNSNVENAFDIARLLGQEGFIIAGRETVRGDNEGVQIDASGSCIRIVIGVYKPG